MWKTHHIHHILTICRSLSEGVPTAPRVSDNFFGAVCGWQVVIGMRRNLTMKPSYPSTEAHRNGSCSSTNEQSWFKTRSTMRCVRYIMIYLYLDGVNHVNPFPLILPPPKTIKPRGSFYYQGVFNIRGEASP
jgi:hypothetical protein